MKLIKYTPKLEREGQKVFSGTITVKMQKHADRQRSLNGALLAKDKDGKFEMVPEHERVVKLIELAEQFVAEVNLVRLVDDTSFTSVDDLNYDKDGSEVLAEVALLISEGATLGKSYETKSSPKQD